MKTVHWEGQTFNNIDANATVEEIRQAIAVLNPAVANANARVEGNDVYFEVRTGTKG